MRSLFLFKLYKPIETLSTFQRQKIQVYLHNFLALLYTLKKRLNYLFLFLVVYHNVHFHYFKKKKDIKKSLI